MSKPFRQQIKTHSMPFKISRLSLSRLYTVRQRDVNAAPKSGPRGVGAGRWLWLLSPCPLLPAGSESYGRFTEIQRQWLLVRGNGAIKEDRRYCLRASFVSRIIEWATNTTINISSVVYRCHCRGFIFPHWNGMCKHTMKVDVRYNLSWPLYIAPNTHNVLYHTTIEWLSSD